MRLGSRVIGELMMDILGCMSSKTVGVLYRSALLVGVRLNVPA